MQPSAEYDSCSMKPVLALIWALLCCSAMQNPTAPLGPVPISEEPHHRLVLQNDFTHVYNVMVPALDATLLHQHDLPYLYVTLGAADIINAIVGKPNCTKLCKMGKRTTHPGILRTSRAPIPVCPSITSPSN